MFKREARFDNLMNAALVTAVSDRTVDAHITATRAALHENKLLTPRGNLKRWVGKKLRVESDPVVAESVKSGTTASFGEFVAALDQQPSFINVRNRGIVRNSISAVLMGAAAEKAVKKVNARLRRQFRFPTKIA